MFRKHEAAWASGNSSVRGMALLCVVACGLVVAPSVWAQSGPKIFDWAINQDVPTGGVVPATTPIPWSDQSSYWNDTKILNTYTTYQLNADKYVGFLLRSEPDAPVVNYAYQKIDNSNSGYYYSDGYISKTVNGAPVTPYYNQTEANSVLAQYPTDQRDTVTNTMNWLNTNVGRLNYVFMDYEASHLYNGAPLRDVNTQVTAQQVHAVFPNAKLGNYSDFPGTEDLSELWPSRIDRTHSWSLSNSDRNAFYLNSGLHVAMPNLYPYSFYIVHATSAWNNFRGQNYVSPNQRSALFWAPLEKLSTAARALPAGDELIPWVNDFIQWTSNGAPAYVPDSGQKPTLADNAASLMHYRLRGADGYYLFQPTMDYNTYRTAMYNAWSSLDPLFNHLGAQRVLNLDTNKIGGIEWSGVVKGNRAGVLVSNLNTTTQTVNWAGKLQLPAQSPTVAPGTHVLLQYRTSYLDNNDMRQYTAGNAMNNQGANSWSGPQPGAFSASAPPDSSPAVVSTGAYAYQRAWYTSSNPGYIATDKVVYSAWLYNGNSVAGFAPANTVGASPTDMPDSNHEGPSIWINGGNLKLRSLFDGGTTYSAVNLPSIANKWYEVQMVVDPTVGAGLGSVWVRNVAAGQKDFTRVVFTTGADRLLYVPLSLDVNRTTTSFNGWSIEAYGAGNAISNLNTGYYVPRMDDNFEHYQTGVTNNNQPINEIKWYGPTGTGAHGPSEWTVAAPYGSGNSSALAATPTSTAYTPRAWWKTERPDFTVTEPTVYSAQLYGTSGVGFEAVNTTGNSTTALTNNNQVGFYAYIYWGALRFRPSRASGDNYQATNFTAQSGKWYDVQVQIDQTRDIDGTAGGNYGVARIWVKNLTDNTAPILLSFDDINTTTVEALTELPMFLSTNLNNPTLWDGWEVYGYNQSVQIDGLRSFLYPFNDFGAYNQYIDEVNTHTAFFIPEPATCALLAFGMFGLFRRPLAR